MKRTIALLAAAITLATATPATATDPENLAADIYQTTIHQTPTNCPGKTLVWLTFRSDTYAHYQGALWTDRALTLHFEDGTTRTKQRGNKWHDADGRYRNVIAAATYKPLAKVTFEVEATHVAYGDPDVTDTFEFETRTRCIQSG